MDEVWKTLKLLREINSDATKLNETQINKLMQIRKIVNNEFKNVTNHRK